MYMYLQYSETYTCISEYTCVSEFTLYVYYTNFNSFRVGWCSLNIENRPNIIASVQFMDGIIFTNCQWINALILWHKISYLVLYLSQLTPEIVCFCVCVAIRRRTKLLPRQGIEPRPRRWERRILTTRPPGMAAPKSGCMSIQHICYCRFVLIKMIACFYPLLLANEE